MRRSRSALTKTLSDCLPNRRELRYGENLPSLKLNTGALSDSHVPAVPCKRTIICAPHVGDLPAAAGVVTHGALGALARGSQESSDT